METPIIYDKDSVEIGVSNTIGSFTPLLEIELLGAAPASDLMSSKCKEWIHEH